MTFCRTTDEMRDALLAGGWTPVHAHLWKSPWGILYLGPHKAWHVMDRSPMCNGTDVPVYKPKAEL